MIKICVLAYKHALLSSIGSFTDTFQIANEVLEANGEPALFECHMQSHEGDAVVCSTGIELRMNTWQALEQFDMLFLPALHFARKSQLMAHVEHLATELSPIIDYFYARRLPIIAPCSASFLVAQCGLLNGKEAVTSWWLKNLFRRKWPDVALDEEAMMADADGVITGGPANTHFNLALHLLERAHSTELAAQCARLLMIDTQRPPQRAFEELISKPEHHDSLVKEAQRLIQENLESPQLMQILLSELAVSQRTLIRRFHSSLGQSPNSAIKQARMSRAQYLLEATDHHLEEIREAIGYQDLSSFRKAFKATCGLTPSEFRAKFSRKAQT